jgi:hypothetical protein
MRWLILLPAIPGALLGGWIGEHAGLVQALGAAGLGAAVLAVLGWRGGVIAAVRVLPSPADDAPEAHPPRAADSASGGQAAAVQRRARSGRPRR